MQLGNSLKLNNRLKAFSPLDFEGLEVWLRSGVGVTKSGDSVTSWADQSANGNDAIQPTSANQPTSTTNGRVTFDGVRQFLGLETQLNLDAFTIIMHLDPDEAGTLSNDAPLGKGGNDVIKMYRAADNERIAIKANGVQSEINPMQQDSEDVSFPTQPFLLTCIRTTSNVFKVRLNGVESGSVTSAISDVFDVTQIGSGAIASTQYSGDILSVAIFKSELVGTDLTRCESAVQAV